MKQNIRTKILKSILQKGVLAVSGALLLTSCTIQTGAYSETDGVYYNPNRDTLPVGAVVNGGNRVGDYYDYQYGNQNQNYSDQTEIVYDRYRDWNGQQEQQATYPGSDWGYYTGAETNYYDWGWNNWGWGGPFGFNAGWGFGGWNYGFGWGMNWGSPWGWYGGFSPYWNTGWGWGNPWGWYGGFNPYWGGGIYGAAPYYGAGYNSYNAPGFTNRRSGVNGRAVLNPRTARMLDNSTRNSSVRSQTRYNTPRYNNQGTDPRSQGRYRTQPSQNIRTRNYDYNSTPRNSQPSYSSPRSSDGGFRSGGMNSGGMRSGGMSSGGGMRSGGGRR